MAYNLREDLKQFQKAATQLLNENRYSASCQIWNDDMTRLVNEYKQEETEWYNSPRIAENGF